MKICTIEKVRASITRYDKEYFQDVILPRKDAKTVHVLCRSFFIFSILFCVSRWTRVDVYRQFVGRRGSCKRHSRRWFSLLFFLFFLFMYWKETEKYFLKKKSFTVYKNITFRHNERLMFNKKKNIYLICPYNIDNVNNT